jgi:predicted esterase
MLTFDRRYLTAVGLNPDRDLSGMIGLAGPYDFLPFNDPELGEIFAPAVDLRETQPIIFARGDAAPMLLLYGLDDTTVHPRNTMRLAERIREDGGEVEVRTYRHIGHRLLLGALARPIRWLAPVLEDVVGFIGGARVTLSIP